MFLDPAWVPIHVSYKVFYEHERRTIKRYELIYTKPMFTSIFDSRMRKEVISRQFQVVLDLCSYSSLVQNILCKKGLVLLLIGWKKKQPVTRDWLCSVFTFIEGSHIGPSSKSNKLRPSWFPKPILWEFKFFLM